MSADKVGRQKLADFIVRLTSTLDISGYVYHLTFLSQFSVEVFDHMSKFRLGARSHAMQHTEILEVDKSHIGFILSFHTKCLENKNITNFCICLHQ